MAACPVKTGDADSASSGGRKVSQKINRLPKGALFGGTLMEGKGEKAE